jgi:hypothetical protein
VSVPENDQQLIKLDPAIHRFYLVWKTSEVKKSLLHGKKRLTIFPSPAGMSLTKLSLAGNDLIITGQVESGK